MASTEGKDGANGHPRLCRVCLHFCYWAIGIHKRYEPCRNKVLPRNQLSCNEDMAMW